MKIINLRFLTGLFLVLLSWYLNWSMDGLRTHLLFFPLWLGYILTVDSIVYFRKRSSLFIRSKKKFILLFLISAPAWWIFELFNLRTLNWIYAGKEYFTEFEYAVYATFSFSTVMPAVFETAELVSTFKWTNNFSSKFKIMLTISGSWIFFITGLIMLFLILLFPGTLFFLIWISVYLLLEPVNCWLGSRTVFDNLSDGNWKPVVCLVTGCLVCGFFWEMWNYYSYPKWIYDIHFANVLYIFEMPLPGYLGYIPFSLELFVVYNFISGLFRIENDSFLNFD